MSLTDIGTALAQSLLDQIGRTLAVVDAETPAWMGQVGGAAVPTVDACQGMIWVRVASQYPTDGSGAQLTATRFDSSIPAWVVSLEVGHLWCHPVIEEDGASPDQIEWEGCAQRDGQYRLAVLGALNDWRSEMDGELAKAALAQTIAPWAPIGPDGGYSGGLVVVNTIVGALALC